MPTFERKATGYVTAMFCGVVTLRYVGWLDSPHRYSSDWLPSYDWTITLIATGVGALICIVPTMIALSILNRFSLRGVHWFMVAAAAICVATWTLLAIPFDADQIGWMLQTNGKAMCIAGGVAGVVLWLFLRPDTQATA